MDELELLEKVSKKENYQIELKERLPDKRSLSKEIVCFANSEGGQIFVGVDDDGKIIGVEDVDESMLIVDNVANQNCKPPVTVYMENVQIENKIVLVINIPKGSHRPYCTITGQYYIRSSNRCRQASREELLRLFQANESLYYDETPVVQASLDDLDIEYFKDFIYKFLQIKIKREEVKSILKNLHLLSDSDKPTISGLLFFGNNPQRFFPNYKIICANIPGYDISIAPSDKKGILGKVSSILEDTMRFFKLYLTESHRIKGIEPEIIFEIPEVALREVIVNAIAHRDYTIEAPIRAIIFKDRIEIHSPGRLPNTVTIESIKLGGSHVLRNPTIYNLLSKMGLVTDLGSGVRRVIQIVRESLNKEVSFYETEGEFTVVIPRR
ncbi:putative DNA binding domain-containing protein [candidate division WOR-3 bacterium]|nr:putative DNA binding domain-containing protein [candidate division WOR-3 bacterium]